jgi:multiple sugar transport system ATP-binding protein
MVFQNYALYPHMSVYKNLSFGLTLRFGGGVFARGLRRLFRPRLAAELNQLRGGIEHQVRQTAARLGIDHLLDRKPHQLSGGERQRVALGRAIVRNPAAFLFDEPLSNLDAKLRQQMRVELKRLHNELSATMIYVTHDQIEAMTLGDRVAVMNDGKILQVGSPLEIYQQPVNLFVARFIGSVPINLWRGTVKQNDEQVVFDGGAFRLNSTGVALKRLMNAGVNDVEIGFRCEDVTFVDVNDPTACTTVAIAELDRLGDSTLVYATVESDRSNRPDEPTDENQTLVARISATSGMQRGDRFGLRVETDKVLWFDGKTGTNLLKENK